MPPDAKLCAQSKNQIKFGYDNIIVVVLKARS